MEHISGSTLFVPGALPIYVRAHIHQQSVNRHEHSFYELVLMDSGYSMHESCGTRCVLTTGDVVGIAPGVAHTYYNPFHARIYNCIFRMEALDGMLPPREELDVEGLIFASPRRLHPDADTLREMTRTLAMMEREFETRASGWQMKMKGQLAALLITVARQYSLMTTGSGGERYVPAGAIYQALDVLEKRYAEVIRLPELAAPSGLSPDYFSRLFKEQVGMGPMEYLRVLRIGRACTLLVETDLPIWAVAGKVGLADENYFARVFRQVTGLSPSVWREKERGNVL